MPSLRSISAVPGLRCHRGTIRRRRLLWHDPGQAGISTSADFDPFRRHRPARHLSPRPVLAEFAYFITLFEELLDHGVSLDVVTSPELGVAALDKLMLNVLASFAEFERDLVASRIAEARDHLKAHGRRIAGAVPFGYAADRHTKQLVVCDEDAQAVVRMFQWAEAGVTPSVIAGYANAFHWITGGGHPWTARQVLAILGNHVYAGLVMHGSRLREGCHPGLIDREVYDNVQNVIAGRRTHAPRRRVSGAGILWILRGLLCCGGCGRLMSTHTVRSGPVIHGYYRCRSTAGGRKACKGVMISAYEIESAVLSEIGAGPKLTSKEQHAAVRAAVRAAVYDAPSGNVKIELVAPPGAYSHRRMSLKTGIEVGGSRVPFLVIFGSFWADQREAR